MKLFLTSVGLEPEYQDDFLQLLSKKPTGTKLAFIPTACDPEPDKSYVKQTRDEIQATGIKVFDIDLKEENEQSLYEKLSKADVICVNGGNTFYLLDWVKKSGFDKVVKKLTSEGKIYFGVSAGSYIACPTIEAAKWKHLGDPDVVGMTDLSALGLVNFLMVAHYEEKYKEDVENGAKTTNLPVVTLTNKQAIIVENDEIKFVGVGNTLKYNGFKFYNE